MAATYGMVEYAPSAAAIIPDMSAMFIGLIITESAKIETGLEGWSNLVRLAGTNQSLCTKKTRHIVWSISWQGRQFDNITFEDELDFDVSEIDQIFDNSDEETK